MKQTTPYSHVIHRNQPEYGRLVDALKGEQVARFGQKRAMPLGSEVTLVRLPHFDARGAENLLALRSTLETHFADQICTATESGKVDFERFITRVGRRKVPRILRVDQTHLFEHLIYHEASKIREKNDLPFDGTVIVWLNKGRSPGHRERRRYLILFNSTFRQPEFDELLTLVWHWLGQAIAGQGFPTAEQLARMVEIRNQTLKSLTPTP